MEEFSPVQIFSETAAPQRIGELIPLIEAVIFAAPEPVRLQQMAEILEGQGSEDEIQQAVDSLQEFYHRRPGGFRLENLGKLGYQFRTVEQVAPIMEKQFAAHARPLSRSALETLSIIAYRQPCTRADIEFVRGVDAGSIITGLLAKNLITCVGRKEEVGRPMLFGTTDEFLKVFRLGTLKELPSLQSFQPPVEVLQGATLDTAEPVRVDIEGLVANGEVDLLPETIETTDDFVTEDDLPSEREASTHGTDETTEVDFPTGTGIETGSGEMDHGEKDPS